MSQIETPVGPADHRDHTPVEQGNGTGPGTPVVHRAPASGGRPVAALIAGGLLCLLCLGLLYGAGWSLWKDRIARDGAGFVPIRTSELRTDQYAIVGSLQGDGPSWLYSSTFWGDERVRATSLGDQPLFVGIARTSDVFAYLKGAGYASVEGFEIRPSSVHPGDAPSGRPSDQSIWAATTQGTGRQTLRWTPRSGKWSVVFMNADAGGGVAVRGTASAELPVLLWAWILCLLLAAVTGLIGGRKLARAIAATSARR